MFDTRKSLENQNKLSLLRAAELAPMLGISQTTLWRWRNRSHMKFPRPICLGSRSLGWKLADIESWINCNTLGGDKA